MTTFCWLPPESAPTGMSVPAVRMPRSLTISSIRRCLGGAVDDAARRDAVEGGEGEVVAHRHRQHQPLGLAVLGDQRHADAGARAGRGWRCATGLPSTSTLPLEAAQHAEERQQQFALALAVEAAEADDLAAADRRSEMSRSRSVQARPRHSSTGVAAARRGRCAAGRRGCTRGRSSSRRLPRRSWCRPRRSRRCGRCGTRCIRRRARRSRACGARCRGAPALRRAAASARRRPSRRRRRSAPRSPRRGSGCAACAPAPWRSRPSAGATAAGP